MSRLTKKHRFLELYIAKENVPQHIAFDKLGKLEDIEDELGCPLEVVFKALNEGIYKVDEDIIFEATLRIRNGEIYLCQPYDDMLLHKVHTKDYQKTWWLKGDKDEQSFK